MLLNTPWLHLTFLSLEMAKGKTEAHEQRLTGINQGQVYAPERTHAHTYMHTPPRLCHTWSDTGVGGTQDLSSMFCTLTDATQTLETPAECCCDWCNTWKPEGDGDAVYGWMETFGRALMRWPWGGLTIWLVGWLLLYYCFCYYFCCYFDPTLRSGRVVAWNARSTSSRIPGITHKLA